MNTVTPKRGWSKYLGAIIGYEGWVIGMSFVLFSSGSSLEALRYIMPSAVLCMGLALSSVIVLELLEQHPANTPALRFRTLWALLLTHMGIMMLILNEWLLPGMEANEAFQSSLSATHSMTSVPTWVAWALIAAGCLLMLQSAKLILRLDADACSEGSPAVADDTLR